MGREEVGSCCGGELGRVKGEVSEGGQKGLSGEVGRARGDERVCEGEVGYICSTRGRQLAARGEARLRTHLRRP